MTLTPAIKEAIDNLDDPVRTMSNFDDRDSGKQRDRSWEEYKVARDALLSVVAAEEGRKYEERVTALEGMLKSALDIVDRYVRANDDHRYAQPYVAPFNLFCRMEDAYGYLKGLPDDIRKALAHWEAL